MAKPKTPRPRRASRLGFSGRVIRWVYLLTVATLALVLAAVAEIVPATVLADRAYLGVGSVAAANAAACVLALPASLLGGLRIVARRWLPLLLLLGGNAVAAILFPPPWLLRELQSEDVVFFVETERREYALTIDDGLDPDTTPRLLDVLAHHDARATFFVLGETLDANAPLLRRILAEGHEIANHQWTDAPAVALRADELRTQIERAKSALDQHGGSAWFRPGGGGATESAREAARRNGLTIALGSVFPFDSHLGWTPFLAAYVEGRTRAGSIVILHDRGERGERTAAVLHRVLPRLKARGLSAVTLTELTR